MSDDEDNVIRLDFGGPDVEAVTDRCQHTETQLVPSARMLRCKRCGKQLDPYDVLEEYASGHRVARSWQQASNQAQAALREAKQELARVQSRTRNASRKEATKAVEDERKRWALKLERTNANARQIVELAEKIIRATSPIPPKAPPR